MRVLMSQDLLDLYETGKCKRYRGIERNPELLEAFIRAVDIMKMVTEVNDLNGFSYLHYEKLKYEWTGYSSVRLSNRYVHRLIFTETPDGLEVDLKEIDDSHYGNKR